MSLTLSRRSFVRTLLATGISSALDPLIAQTSPPPRWLLIGDSHGEGIYRAAWDPLKGTLGKPELAVATPQPTFLNLHPRLPVLYACNEVDGADGSISAFALDRNSGRLTHLATQTTRGGSPCFASVGRTGRLLFVANYAGGSLAVFPLSASGRPEPIGELFDCAHAHCGPGGPVKDRQSSAHLHCATLSPDNRYVLACDLGDDAILAFPIHPGAAHPLGEVTRIQTAAGAGPRHLAFHPNGRWLYCINEIDCTVSLYLWRPRSNQPAAESVPDATVSIRPQNAANNPPSTAAELRIAHDGRFLYTSTRFSDVLTVFSIDPGHGRLTEIQQLPCGGKTPRFFALDPGERWLVCANQDSDSINVFARDGNTGRLTPGGTFPATNPECLLWL